MTADPLQVTFCRAATGLDLQGQQATQTATADQQTVANTAGTNVG
jgi:hypothetical protein